MAAAAPYSSRAFLALLVVALSSCHHRAAAFIAPRIRRHPFASPGVRIRSTHDMPSSSSLYAKKQKKKTKSKSSGGGGGGGGFGAGKPAHTILVSTVSADKNSLEKQWDAFASITDLEIAPKGDPEDDDYRHFIVCDVFVRVGGGEKDNGGGGENEEGTGWYRTGKVAAADRTDLNAALTLQKGLIFWTAAHMWPQLAARGKAAANLLQLGFMPPSMCMASENDAALDDDEAEDVIVSHRVSVQGVSIKDVGFRPDFNPPNFTYKRREKAAMKKKKTAIEEIEEVS